MKNQHKTINDQWIEFKRVAIDPGAPQILLNYMKIAFFSGFTEAILSITSKSPDQNSEEDSVDDIKVLFTRYSNEISGFSLAIESGSVKG